MSELEGRNTPDSSSSCEGGTDSLGLRHRQESSLVPASDAQSTMWSIGSPTPLLAESAQVPVSSDNTSATFHSGLENDGEPADLALISFDNIFFYAHSSVLRDASENAFGGLLPPAEPTCISLPETQTLHRRIRMLEPAAVAETMLYAIYERPFVYYPASPAALFSACEGLTKYGVSVARCLTPSHPLYSSILAFAPTRPIEVYVLAAEHDAYELARAASSHLHSFDLAGMDDQLASKLGPYYLKRLFLLHINRVQTFRGLLRGAVPSHPPTTSCSLKNQEIFQNAWFLVTGYLCWDVQPDTSVATLASRLEPVRECLSCELCQEALSRTIAELQNEWLKVNNSIE